MNRLWKGFAFRGKRKEYEKCKRCGGIIVGFEDEEEILMMTGDPWSLNPCNCEVI